MCICIVVSSVFFGNLNRTPTTSQPAVRGRVLKWVRRLFEAVDASANGRKSTGSEPRRTSSKRLGTRAFGILPSANLEISQNRGTMPQLAGRTRLRICPCRPTVRVSTGLVKRRWRGLTWPATTSWAKLQRPASTIGQAWGGEQWVFDSAGKPVAVTQPVVATRVRVDLTPR